MSFTIAIVYFFVIAFIMSLGFKLYYPSTPEQTIIDSVKMATLEVVLMPLTMVTYALVGVAEKLL